MEFCYNVYLYVAFRFVNVTSYLIDSRDMTKQHRSRIDPRKVVICRFMIFQLFVVE